jgi:ActR/RegA family two-component response regulator
VRVVTVAPAASRGRVRELDTSGRLVVVLDTDAGWERAAIEGHQVTVLPPGEDALERLADLVPVRIVANLAAERTLETLAALRAAGSTARFWGCLALPAAERALPIGMVEAATRPIDPDAILAALGTYAARGTRVVTAGADVDELMSLRQALSRRRMSVSMAWDGKQATDLLGVVRPEIVVVDLELGKREGYAIVARLGAVSPIAIAVVIPASEDAAAGFAAVAADPEHTSRAIPLDRLIADTLGRSEAPASERRPQKLRALGRK